MKVSRISQTGVVCSRIDNHVYVWQTNLNKPVEVLEGHDETVNSVAWNPVASRKLFASCSDDSTIRIWQPASLDEEEGETIEPKVEPMDEDGVAEGTTRSNGTDGSGGMDL